MLNKSSKNGMLREEHAVKEMWRHAEKMPYQAIRDVYSTQKRAGLMGAGGAILKCFAGPM